MKGARRIQGSVVSIITPLFPRERKSNKLKRDGMIEVSDSIHPDEKQGRRRLIASTSFSSRGSCAAGAGTDIMKGRRGWGLGPRYILGP